MPYEDPREILRKLRLGREEFCQRLVTTLIVGGVYPKWGTINTPTASGSGFLHDLDTMSFGESVWSEATKFVDEFELPRRVESEPGGYPDWAALTDDRLWLIELKTEPGSHRQEQLPYYLELAAHHYPDRRIDLTYLTGPLSRPTPPTNGGQRYAHLTWGDILPLVSRWWTDSRDKGPAAYMDALSRVCRSLDVSWSAWRDDYVGTHVPGPRWPTSEEILAVVTATAQTRKQQAIDFAAQSLDSLHTLRLEARGLIQESPFGSPMRHVLPWVWSTASTGAALTAAGAENGRDFASRTTPSRNTRLEGAM